MPGTKRKMDEDTWIVTQSKKFKCGQLLANVYEGTLAQLRLGARNFFKRSSSSSAPGEIPTTPPSSPVSDFGGGDDETPSCSSLSPVIRDVVSHNEDDGMTGGVVICAACSVDEVKMRDVSWEKCYYCEMTVCHVNPCQGCNEGFCGNCVITKYDNPSFETFSCYACLH